ILLGGESGVGKTRLAMELAKEANKLNVMVLVGECQDGHVSDPLGILKKPLQVLEDYCRERGRLEIDRIFGPRGVVLGPYKPSLLTLSGQSEQPPLAEVPPEEARWRLFGALKEALLLFTADRPLLLVLDDLQWADELSLGFLAYLTKGPLSR